MSLAPQDGSIIEIENRFGAVPWRGLFRWANSAWRGALDSNIGIYKGAYAWRSFAGDPKSYSNPYARVDAYDYVILGRRPFRKLAVSEVRYHFV